LQIATAKQVIESSKRSLRHKAAIRSINAAKYDDATLDGSRSNFERRRSLAGSFRAEIFEGSRPARNARVGTQRSVSPRCRTGRPFS